MEDGQEDKIMSKLFEDATRAVFERFMGDEAEVLALQFSDGLNVTTGESIPSNEYEDIVRKVDGLSDIANKLGGDNSAIRASVVEFVLEGLHLNQLLNKDRVSGHNTYSA